jgi:hypothetical protein
VEEEPDEDRPGGVTRRLIFLQNQNFIQTEIKMMEKKNSKNIKAKKGAKDKKKDKKVKNDDEDNMDIDYGYFDDHHRAVLSGFVLYPEIITMCSKVIHKHVPPPPPSSTHGSNTSAGNDHERVPVGMVIGLGGGAFPMCLQKYLPGMRLYSCDLDGEVLSIAMKHFGFKCTRYLCV